MRTESASDFSALFKTGTVIVEEKGLDHSGALLKTPHDPLMQFRGVFHQTYWVLDFKGLVD
ncbi:MAG: hypothetical protein WCT14_17880, partial [Treponemataceae bacterium]